MDRIKMSHNVRTCTFIYVRPARIQVSLHIRTIRSESSLGTTWMAKDAKLLHVDKEDSDQTAKHQCETHKLTTTMMEQSKALNHYENTTIQIYWDFTTKKWKLSDENFW